MCFIWLTIEWDRGNDVGRWFGWKTGGGGKIWEEAEKVKKGGGRLNTNEDCNKIAEEEE